ncbi:hypothetical protein [Streptomyces monashensis]|uniref:Secreted protein n=1 Tax=Streptomyces monashensis TaxID=1678012 RepID=A0A1S2PS05_9ACTN|nr:hypothetical protein [Streptomyces monashensis]OIJ96597.1 hypothetical protein BIV23_32185 [Streptomyces monashensis]
MGLGVIAAAFAATAAAVLPTAGTAQAVVRYVGEVERQYDSCRGQAIAHREWAGTWQQSHSGTTSVAVYLQASNLTHSTVPNGRDTQKDVTARGDIHATSPDQWAAHAVVSYGLYCGTFGTMHDYSNGGTVSGPHPTHC